MIGRFIGIVISLIGLILPWRLRILFSEFLGWVTQAIYFTYFGIFNFILSELRKAKEMENKEKDEASS
ncbi:MAG: hypothetical protein CME70_09005 [Halobacteriovorax sp.]|nr:hypothetical protein [Halobacteriovorax sp.]|tara:strand:+ start:43112 stop:43315 length:204 start_codon:yes stop_codon:yes gene_type:complete